MIGTEVISKAGYQIDPSKEYDFKVKSMPFVSRGGFKLKKALESFDVIVKDRICLDAGASTGGFTDCMLQNGAVKVFSIDVGYGQLAWKLRQDERVVCMERTNIRYVTIEDTKEFADFASIDVSFISLKLVLPKAKELLNIEKPNRDLLFTIIDRIEADEDRNITIKFKYKILEDYTFKYVDKNPIRNPYGRCGKKSKI